MEERREDDTECSPSVLLEGLEKITQSTSLKTPMQGALAIPLIHQYCATLDGVRVPSIAELARAKKLAFSELYYSSDQAMQQAAAQGASDLPLATLGLEGELIRHCRSLLAKGHPESVTLQNFADSMTNDLFWYNTYQKRPDVWNAAARQYCRCRLPEEGQLDFTTFARFLRTMEHRQGPIAQAVFSHVKERIDWKRTQPERFEAMAADERIAFLRNWEYLREHTKQTNPEEREESGASVPSLPWYEHHAKEYYVPVVRHLPTLALTAEERLALSAAFAQGIRTEGGLSRIRRQISRWGYDPIHALSAFPRSRGAEGRAYGIGPCSDITLDLYRAMRGDDSALFARLGGNGSPSQRASIRRNLQTNSPALFLGILRSLSHVEHHPSPEWWMGSKDTRDEEAEDCVSTFSLLVQQSMTLEAAYRAGLPDLPSWGEQAGLLLSIACGTGNKTAEELQQERLHFLQGILRDGFPDPLAPEPERGQKIPGIFTQFDERLPDTLCDQYDLRSPARRKAMSASPLLAETRAGARQQFIATFMAVAGPVVSPATFLRWGITREELDAFAEKAERKEMGKEDCSLPGK